MKFVIAALAAFGLTGCAHAETNSHDAKGENMSAQDKMDVHFSDGVVRKVSEHSVEETVARLEAALAARNIKVMAKVDHAANAAGVDLDLPPTTLVIFGNPAAGTQLMQAARSIAIDLPMKALVYEKNGVVYYEYNAVRYLAARHDVLADLPVLSKIEGLLAAVAEEATGD